MSWKDGKKLYDIIEDPDWKPSDAYCSICHAAISFMTSMLVRMLKGYTKIVKPHPILRLPNGSPVMISYMIPVYWIGRACKNCTNSRVLVFGVRPKDDQLEELPENKIGETLPDSGNVKEFKAPAKVVVDSFDSMSIDDFLDKITVEKPVRSEPFQVEDKEVNLRGYDRFTRTGKTSGKKNSHSDWMNGRRSKHGPVHSISVEQYLKEKKDR